MAEGFHLDFYEEAYKNRRHDFSESKWRNFMHKAVYAAGIFGAVMTIPQITKIWIEKNAAGVSAISWSAYLAGAIVWLIYGITFKRKPIVFVYSIWIVLEIIIIIGTIIYG